MYKSDEDEQIFVYGVRFYNDKEEKIDVDVDILAEENLPCLMNEIWMKYDNIKEVYTFLVEPETKEEAKKKIALAYKALISTQN